MCDLEFIASYVKNPDSDYLYAVESVNFSVCKTTAKRYLSYGGLTGVPHLRLKVAGIGSAWP